MGDHLKRSYSKEFQLYVIQKCYQLEDIRELVDELVINSGLI
ncbi:hypothetical protein [Halalkalibaculum roseum]|nr:hypothetical protein [Halalkalibaculum roseum]